LIGDNMSISRDARSRAVDAHGCAGRFAPRIRSPRPTS